MRVSIIECNISIFQYAAFRTERSVTIMICVVWFLSALVSLPTLLYPPWRIPFNKPSDNNIQLHERDKIFLNSINGTKELAHHKCQVSTFLNPFFNLSKLKFLIKTAIKYIIPQGGLCFKNNKILSWHKTCPFLFYIVKHRTWSTYINAVLDALFESNLTSCTDLCSLLQSLLT